MICEDEEPQKQNDRPRESAEPIQPNINKEKQVSNLISQYYETVGILRKKKLVEGS